MGWNEDVQSDYNEMSMQWSSESEYEIAWFIKFLAKNNIIFINYIYIISIFIIFKRNLQYLYSFYIYIINFYKDL